MPRGANGHASREAPALRFGTQPKNVAACLLALVFACLATGCAGQAAVGATTTLAGSSQGFADAAGASARFNQPFGVSVSPDGQWALVADGYNNRIRKVVVATGAVSTLAGQSS